MKRFLFFIAACCLYSLQAQDVIVLYDKTELEAKVIEVRENEVLYKNWNNLEGPTYVIGKERIDYIKYVNGTKEDLNSNVKGKLSSEIHGKYIHNILLNGYLELGLPFSSVTAGPNIQGFIGSRIYDYSFVGFGVGFDAIFCHQISFVPNPSFMDVYSFLMCYTSISRAVPGSIITNIPILFIGRFFYPIKENLYPFFDLSCGINFLYASYSGIYQDDHGNYQTQKVNFKYAGVYPRIKILFGIEYKRLEVGMGYDCIPIKKASTIHMGYFKIGLRIGEMK